MRILSAFLVTLTLASTAAVLGCSDGSGTPDPKHPVLKLFYGNLFAHGSGKSANLGFHVTVNEGDTSAALPLTMNVAGRVANANDGCDTENKGWNSAITVSATADGFGLTGTVKEKDDCKYSSDLATYLSMNLAIDSTAGAITGAFPPGSGNDIIVADLTFTGASPSVSVKGRLRLTTGDVSTTITIAADGSVTGQADFPGNTVDINGQIDLTVLGQIPAQTIAASLLANAIEMSRY